MIRATIKKLDGTFLDHGDFTSEETALEFFQPRIDGGVYGQKHVPAQEVPAVLDLEGNEITSAYVLPEVPAAFSIEFADIASIPKSQDEINAEALKLLADTDWMIIREAEGGTACPAEVKSARAAARLAIVR